jgi:hypothetical protein
MCSVENCFGEVRARGWCAKHYRKWRQYGDPLAGRFQGVNCARGHDLTDPANVYNNGRSNQCRICMAAGRRVYRLASKYGLTPEAWESLFETQGRCCAICQTTESHRWSVDHDHSCCPDTKTCGQCIRGILCFQCNLRMRALDEWSDEELLRAQAYKHNRPILTV